MTAVETSPSAAAAQGAPAPRPEPLMADPMPIAYALFGFALAVFGIRFATVDASSLAGGRPRSR